MRNTGEDAYFAASNSSQGFCSYYRECFDHPRVDRVYAVKGGPGTGKSRFLREVAGTGERRGWHCEYIYCSSDPDSLDGVILSRGQSSVALMDATAPHVYEPSHPGVREEIVNLGEFWNADFLRAHGERIEHLCREKSAAYRMCYRYLAGAGEVMENRRELVGGCLHREKIKRAAQKLMCGIPRGAGYDPKPALMGSLGMKGRVRLDTFCRLSRRLVAIEPYHGVEDHFMDALLWECRERELEVRISRDPVLPWRADGLLLPRDGVAFVIREEKEAYPEARLFSTRRFADAGKMRRVREGVTYAERCYRAMVGGAEECLESAEEAHFALEEIYVSAMDFTKKESFTKDFCRRLFDLHS